MNDKKIKEFIENYMAETAQNQLENTDFDSSEELERLIDAYHSGFIMALVMIKDDKLLAETVLDYASKMIKKYQKAS